FCLSPVHRVMIRRPPSPPLFPYTTLFRSLGLPTVDATSLAHAQCAWDDFYTPLAALPSDAALPWAPEALHALARQALAAARPLRSEEHTSELQSREKLVCRLLLEKKKRRP